LLRCRRIKPICSSARMFISFDGRAPPAVVVAEAAAVVVGLGALAGVAGAALGVAVLEGPAVVVAAVGGVLVRPAPVDADVAAVELALASVAVAAAVGGVLVQPVPVVACVVAVEPALAALVSVAAAVDGVLVRPAPVDAAVAAVEPALASLVSVAAVYATVQPVPVVACAVVAEPALAALVSVAADVEFAELVLARDASGRLPSDAGGALDQPVLVDVDVAGPHRVVSATVQSAVFRVSGSQAVFDDQAVAHGLVRSASDDQAVVVQPVFGGLAVVHVKLQVAFFVPVVDEAIRPAYFGGLPKLFPVSSVSACLVRWIAGFQGSAADQANSVQRPDWPRVFFPDP